MEEDSLRFWIIPIICFVAFGIIFAAILDYTFNVKIPSAVVEQAQMKEMSCDEIGVKVSKNLFWSTENEKYAKDRVKACSDAKAAIRKAEQDKLDKLLADPNSLESLTRDLEKSEKLYDTFKEEYALHSSKAEILKQNVTDFENKINEIKSKIQEKYG